MAPRTLTLVDHLISITNYLQGLHPELSREQAYAEAIIQYRRYGLRADDLGVRS